MEPVQHPSAMHVLESLEELVHDILLVDLFQNVGTDNSVEVGIHELEHKVDVAVVVGLHAQYRHILPPPPWQV